MIAKVESSINKNSLFYSKKEEIIKKMCSIFNVIEKKNTRSIVKKMCKAIYSENNKLVYRSPLLQVIGTKLYTIFLKWIKGRLVIEKKQFYFNRKIEFDYLKMQERRFLVICRTSFLFYIDNEKSKTLFKKGGGEVRGLRPYHQKTKT